MIWQKKSSNYNTSGLVLSKVWSSTLPSYVIVPGSKSLCILDLLKSQHHERPVRSCNRGYVAAGARFWEDKPSRMLYIRHCFLTRWSKGFVHVFYWIHKCRYRVSKMSRLGHFETFLGHYKIFSSSLLQWLLGSLLWIMNQKGS